MSAKLAALLALGSVCACAQVHPLEQLIETARQGPAAAGLASQIAQTLSPHGGVAVWGGDYLFVSDLTMAPKYAAVSASSAGVSIDLQPPLAMEKVPGTAFWMRLVKMRVGVTHAYQFYADGKPATARTDVSGYNPDSYPKPGVPKGKLSEKHTIVSKIYDGMKADYWYYAAPGVDPNIPAPLMVWQDGQGLIAGDLSRLRLFTVTENLVAQKLIPPMVHVLIAPGFSPTGKAMRSIEYDTVSDRYDRFLLEEVLPEVEKAYKLRPDGYSRAIAGRILRRHLLAERGLVHAGKVQPRAFGHRQLHVHPVASRGKTRRRQLISVHGAQTAETQHPRVDERWHGRSGERARLLAAAKYPARQFAQNARIRFSFPLRPGDA